MLIVHSLAETIILPQTPTPPPVFIKAALSQGGKEKKKKKSIQGYRKLEANSTANLGPELGEAKGSESLHVLRPLG